MVERVTITFQSLCFLNLHLKGSKKYLCVYLYFSFTQVCILPLKLSPLVIVLGAAQMSGGNESLPPSLHGLEILVTDQSQGDLRVPRRTVLRTAEVDLLAGVHDHGEVHQSSLVLHAVHRHHAFEEQLFGS